MGERVWRDGLRHSDGGSTIQRWLCRDCGFRFSELSTEFKEKLHVTSQFSESSDSVKEFPYVGFARRNTSLEKLSDKLSFQWCEDVGSHEGTVVAKPINIFRDYNSLRLVCAPQKETKNLAGTETVKTGLSAAATKTNTEIKGFLIAFVAKSELAGLTSKTIKCRFNTLQLLIRRGTNLLNPESVFQTIDHAKRFDHKTRQLLDEEWSNGSKNNAAQAYKSFTEINSIAIPKHINFEKWTRCPQKLPWVPLEREIDELIAGCSRKAATFLQLLKETGARSGEAWRLKWQDIDMEHVVITFNLPEKGSNPRQIKASQKLIAMLNMLPKTSQRVWGDIQLDQFRKNFMLQRKRVAHKLQNPRINQITFHTLRHFYATMQYHRTKDLLHVQQMLGHRDIKSTLIYTHLVNFEGDEYHTATAKSLKEDEELLKAGFEYVTERDGVKIYRKRK